MPDERKDATPRWSVIEVTPSPDPGIPDPAEVAHAAQQLITRAGGAGAPPNLVLLAAGEALPFAVALGTQSNLVDCLIIFPPVAEIPVAVPELIDMIDSSSTGKPSVLLVYPPENGGHNGPFPDEWLQVFAGSRLARWSHFDYHRAAQVIHSGSVSADDLGELIQSVDQLHQHQCALQTLGDDADIIQGSPEFLEALTSYQGIIATRMAGLDPGARAVWLHDKLSAKQFARSHGFPVADLHEVIDAPEGLHLRHFTEARVIKPVRGNSSLGVKILCRDGDLLQDLKTGEHLSLEDLQNSEREVLRRLGDTQTPSLLLEKPVRDLTGQFNTQDYKFFFAGGEPVLVLAVERTAEGVICWWTDGGFQPMTPSPVWTNPHVRKVREFSRPEAWDSLLELARDVYRVAGLAMTRVDLYLGAQGPVFGEITPTPGNFYYGNADKLAVSTARRIADVTFNPPQQ